MRQIPVLYVGYRDVLEDAAGVAAKVAEFLGKDLDITAMAAVVDKSLGRHRR